MKKSIFILVSAIFIFIFSVKIYSQNTDVIKCTSYEELSKTIKSGKSASVDKTCWINEFKLIEKSTVTIKQHLDTEEGYLVFFEITSLETGNLPESYEDGSVLGFITKGCTGMKENYSQFTGTNCWFYVINPDDAVSAAKSGISKNIDDNYLLDGSLVKVFETVCKEKNHNPMPVKKPAVYLYPEKEMNVSVKVDVNGRLTKTEPFYGNGWNVTASPDGSINGEYDYLFYEADLNKITLPAEGWVVEYSKLENWFDDYLPQLGLNKKEKEQFKEYWLKDLKKANYYEIKLLSNEFLNENMKLDISPSPQTIIRLDFFFKPLSEKKTIKEPAIKRIERKGFTVVEWGGINESDIKIIP